MNTGPASRLLETAWDLHREFAARRAERDRVLEAARDARRGGHPEVAERLYEAVVARSPKDWQAWYELGALRFDRHEPGPAVDALLAAIECGNAASAAHLLLGRIFAGGVPELVGSGLLGRYQRALGLTGHASLESMEAACVAAAVMDDGAGRREGSQDYVRLGHVRMARLMFDRAIESYLVAQRLDSQNAAALIGLGQAYAAGGESARGAGFEAQGWSALGDHRAAVEAYRRAIALWPDASVRPADLYLGLGASYEQRGEIEQAAAVYDEALRVCAPNAALFLRAIGVHHERGRFDRVLDLAQRAADACPGVLALEFARHLTLPVIYEDVSGIDRARAAFERGLAEAERLVRLETVESRREAVDAIGRSTNFFLAYQGRNDLTLQVRYGSLVGRVMAAAYPRWSRRPARRTRPGPVRVGYVSAHLRHHAVASSHGGWLRHADHDRFSVHGYHLGPTTDTVTEAIRSHCDVFRHLGGERLDQVCAAIAGDELDVLVYLDIGMFPAATQLAALHLAPVQCTTWGHPVTSGLASIDYFLSSELMEPADGALHYSEQLIRLPGLGIAYPRPSLPTVRRSRETFGLDPGATVFLCCQSPYKYLPQHDHVLIDIARRVEAPQFVFVGSHPAAAALERRVRSAFGRAGLRDDRMCRFVPALSWPDFLSLLAQGDVFLDTFSWSGCNTALEALALGVPVVTCAGDLMRGRHCHAFLTLLELTGTIAGTAAEYVDSAVMLAQRPDRRADLSAAIRARADRLYDDRAPIAALERFYERVTLGP